MPFVDTKELNPGEPRPGWHDRYFHSDTMSFAYYEVAAGASIHEHFHPEEEVWNVTKGQLEFTLDGETVVLRAGMAAVVPPNVPHSVKALTDARVIIVNHPVRQRIGAHR